MTDDAEPADESLRPEEDLAADPAPIAPAAARENAEPSTDDAEGADAAAARELNRRFAEVRRAVGALEKVLLQGRRKYSRRDLADKQGVPERLTSVYWRSMGFTAVDADTVVFTEEDAYAIGDLAALVEDGEISERTYANISRGLGFHMGRLAMWLTEALVDEAKLDHGANDADARQEMLEEIPRFLEIFENQTMYAFRRQLAAYSARAGTEVLRSSPAGGPDELFPLDRAVGFADLVQFTRLAQSLTGAELADVIGRFEAICRDIVSVGGGRVVKTVGDEVMFLADAPEDGAQIALSLAEAIAEQEELPDVRVGFAWGPMFSRYGDVFGPTVNLAARLEGVAQPGAVLTDAASAEAATAALPGGYLIEPQGSIDLHGIGPTQTVQMLRGSSPALSLRL